MRQTFETFWACRARFAVMFLASLLLVACNNVPGESTPQLKARVEAIASDPAFKSQLRGFTAGEVRVTSGTEGGTWNYGGSVGISWTSDGSDVPVPDAINDLVGQMQASGWSAVMMSCNPASFYLTKTIDASGDRFVASADAWQLDDQVRLGARDSAIDPSLVQPVTCPSE